MGTPVFVEGLCGGIGGATGRLASFPLEALKLQSAFAKAPSSGQLLLVVLRDPFLLFRGSSLSCVDAFVSKTIQFLVGQQLRQWWHRLRRSPGGAAVLPGHDVRAPRTSPAPNDKPPAGATSTQPKLPAPPLVVAMVIGYLGQLCALPSIIFFDGLVGKLQAGWRPIDVFRDAFSKAFLKKMWAILPAYLLTGLKPSVELGLFHTIRAARLAASTSSALPSSAAASLGAGCRFLATVLVYPTIRIRALMAASGADDQTGVAALALQIARTEGASGLYRGFVFEVLRGMLQSAVMFAIAERLRERWTSKREDVRVGAEVRRNLVGEKL